MFVRSVLADRVTLPATRVGANIRDVVARELARKLEGRCSRHGFIAPRSIAVERVWDGVVQAQALDGSVVFRVAFRADVCNPVVGAVVQATVVNKNRFGFLAEAEGGVLEIVVAMPAADVERGDQVALEVLGCKFELNDTRIAVVGRVAGSAGAAAPAGTDDAGANDEDDENDEDAQGSEVTDDEEDDAEDGSTTVLEDDAPPSDAEASVDASDPSDADDNSESEVDDDQFDEDDDEPPDNSDVEE